MTTAPQRIDYRDISDLNLESIDHIPDAGLEGYFREIGNKATAGQLSLFLYEVPGGVSVDDQNDEIKEDLVELYVERRVKVVRNLRSDLSGFSSVIESIKAL